MDLDFLSEDGIFLALIFKENPGCWDDILGVFLLDEAANASFLATDDITKGKALLFIECLPDNFLLASEAFLLESEALLLESEVLLLDWEPLLLASEAFLRESETFLLEAEAFLLEEEASFMEVDAFLLELEAPLLDLETFFLEPENFGPEDIFKALVGTRFPLMRM